MFETLVLITVAFPLIIAIGELVPERPLVDYLRDASGPNEHTSGAIGQDAVAERQAGRRAQD